MKKFIVISLALLMIAGFAITASAVEVDLLAGQNILVGELTVEVDGDNLVVTYDITDLEWELLETHLYVGTEEPKKSAPGQFPYGPESPEYAVIGDDVVYTIDLEGFTGILFIAAQAEVRRWIEDDPDTGEPIYQEETAWAEGDPIRPGKNWAMYFEFTIPSE